MENGLDGNPIRCDLGLRFVFHRPVHNQEITHARPDPLTPRRRSTLWPSPVRRARKQIPSRNATNAPAIFVMLVTSASQLSLATGNMACAAAMPAASLHCSVTFSAVAAVVHVGAWVSMIVITCVNTAVTKGPSLCLFFNGVHLSVKATLLACRARTALERLPGRLDSIA